ncbi:MAG: hypothetical protein C3F02_01870 [Parcubacteria group bacterium]|nr:MAG: hypothetical protein C3F02_01870 [Parcubacteria group bacterium]
MPGFKQKRAVSGQSLGERLKKIRLDQGHTLEEAEVKTKIQLKYLEILENGEYDLLPGDIYARVWIKAYTNFLGVPPEDFLADYKIEKQVSENINKYDRLNQQRRQPKDSVVLRPRNVKLALITLIILAVVGYLIWQVNNIIAPPNINIREPKNNFITTESQLMISGQTVAEAELVINGERVLTDNSGLFSQPVNLVPGLNKFKISAKKKHSRTNYIDWNILRQ